MKNNPRSQMRQIRSEFQKWWKDTYLSHIGWLRVSQISYYIVTNNGYIYEYPKNPRVKK